MYTTRSQFTVHVAAAITGDNPWKLGYSTYHGTRRSLQRRLPQIRREHGGNIVVRWFYHGMAIPDPRDEWLQGERWE